jgi:hypothetical protein
MAAEGGGDGAAGAAEGGADAAEDVVELDEENIRFWEPLFQGASAAICVLDHPDRGERSLLTIDTAREFSLVEGIVRMCDAPLERVKRQPYLQTIWEAWRRCLADALPPGGRRPRVLCLGLGCGILPQALAAEADVEVVEAFPAVLDAARLFFGFEGKRVEEGGRVYVALAEDFLSVSATRGETWDCVIVDIGDAESETEGVIAPAAVLRTRGRLRQLRRMVRSGGLLAANFLWRIGDASEDDMAEWQDDLKLEGDRLEWIPVSPEGEHQSSLAQAVCAVFAPPPSPPLPPVAPEEPL